MHVVIIGAQASGLSCASKLKRLNPNIKISVFEKLNTISLGACGLPYYVGDFFDKSEMLFARVPSDFKDSGIDIKLNSLVTNVDFDKKSIMVKDLITKQFHEVSYDKLVIGTGASSFVPPIENISNSKVYYLKDYQDGVLLKEELTKVKNQRISIIGGGFIGLELVEACLNLGKEVHIFQRNPHFLNQVYDPELANLILEELEDKGVKCHLNTNVLSLEEVANHISVVSEAGEVISDLVVVAVGLKPNTNIVRDKLELLANGAIKINEYGETSIPDVYACGDCASVKFKVDYNDIYVPLGTTANKLGRVIAHNILGDNKTYYSLQSSCLKVLDKAFASVGINEKYAIKHNYNYATKILDSTIQASFYPPIDRIVIKLIYDKDTKVILGAQMCSTQQCIDKIDTLALAISQKLTTEELGMLDFAYSPPYSHVWTNLNVIGNISK